MINLDFRSYLDDEGVVREKLWVLRERAERIVKLLERVEGVQDKELQEGGWDGYNGYTRCS